MKTKNYLEAMRAKANKAVEEGSKKGTGNSLEFVPPIGKTKVRLLPPISEDDYFYQTHSYNYVPNGGTDGQGVMLWTQKKYDGERCPVDEAAAQFYDSNDEAMRKLGSQIKRKRRFYFNAILVDEPDPAKKFVVLVDNTNEGKLTTQICKAMNIPLIRDVEDNWIDQKVITVDPDEEGFDLLDPTAGYDFIIVKSEDVVPIGGGKTIKKASYEGSKPAKSPRALTEEEFEIMEEKRVDLKKFVTYEKDVNKVKAALQRFIDGAPEEDKEEEEAEIKTSKTTNPPIKTAQKVGVTANPKKAAPAVLDAEAEDLLDQI